MYACIRVLVRYAALQFLNAFFFFGIHPEDPNQLKPSTARLFGYLFTTLYYYADQ